MLQQRHARSGFALCGFDYVLLKIIIYIYVYEIIYRTNTCYKRFIINHVQFRPCFHQFQHLYKTTPKIYCEFFTSINIPSRIWRRYFSPNIRYRTTDCTFLQPYYCNIPDNILASYVLIFWCLYTNNWRSYVYWTVHHLDS